MTGSKVSGAINVKGGALSPNFRPTPRDANTSPAALNAARQGGQPKNWTKLLSRNDIK